MCFFLSAYVGIDEHEALRIVVIWREDYIQTAATKSDKKDPVRGVLRAEDRNIRGPCDNGSCEPSSDQEHNKITVTMVAIMTCMNTAMVMGMMMATIA